MPLSSRAKDPRLTDPDLPTVPPPTKQPTSWWVLASLFTLLVIALFIPWNSEHSGPTVDVRPELVWSAILTVVFGAIGLAFITRWIAYVAALPTLGAITDIGPVFLPESGTYPLIVKIVVLLVSAVGLMWLVRARRHPPRGQSTRWVIAPVAAVLTFATLWLPWVIVSGIGEESGQMTAFTLLFGTAWSSASGLLIVKITILAVMVIGVGGALFPLVRRRRPANRIATICALGACGVILLFGLWLAIRGDDVQAAVSAPGQRVALAGLLLLALTWNSQRNIEEDAATPKTDDGESNAVRPTGTNESDTTSPGPDRPDDLALSSGQ